MEEPKIITKQERALRRNGGCSSCGKSITKMENKQEAPKQLPSNWEMLKNLVQAAKEAAQSGLDVRGPEETEAALKICDTCPHLINDGGSFRCGVCGCYLKYKTSLKAWHCPINKW